MADDVFADFVSEFEVSAARGGKAALGRAVLEQDIVPFDQWANDPYHSGNLIHTWPSVRREVREACIDGPNGKGYPEVIFGGAMGGAKTTKACYILVRLVYVLSCFVDPAVALGQEPGKKLVLFFISTTYDKALKAPFSDFKRIVESIPYFREKFPPNFDHPRDTELFFPKNIEARPAATTEKSILSECVPAFYADELDHMNVTRGSKLSRGLSEVYDQAEAVCGEALNRMYSRMMQSGERLGVALFTSSPKYPQSYLQRRIQTARAHNHTDVYISELSLWDAKRGAINPATGGPYYNDERKLEGGFTVELGDDKHLARLLEPGDKQRPGSELVRVPNDFRRRFDPKQGGNLDEAIRDFIGRATISCAPLIEDRSCLAPTPEGCIRQPKDACKVGCDCDTCAAARHPFSAFETYLEHANELRIEDLCAWNDKLKLWAPRKNPGAPRFLHVDGSADTEGGDATGLCMLHQYGTREVIASTRTGAQEYRTEALVHVDLVLRIRRDPSSPKLDWSRIRDLVLQLRDECRFDIVMVSMDRHQSMYFLQELRDQHGFDTDDKMSVDDKPLPYLMLRDALAQRRVSVYEHQFLLKELKDLEFDRRARRVDHPSFSTKDVADALCGAYYKCTTLNSQYAGAPMYSAEERAARQARREAERVDAGDSASNAPALRRPRRPRLANLPRFAGAPPRSVAGRKPRRVDHDFKE